jgi:hypothetical protein
MPASSFFAWRRRLGKSGGDAGRKDLGVGRRDSRGPAFVEVTEVTELAEVAAAHEGNECTGKESGVELRLAAGRRIGVGRGFDPQTLARLLLLLEKMPGVARAREAAVLA